jgi:hypothetical protein
LATVTLTTALERALRLNARREKPRRPSIAILTAVCAVLVVTSPAAAQDSQWWTNQYGNRARLLGGAVIGSSRDLSAVYYNPGGLALVDQPDALLTGYVFELDNIKYKNVLFEDAEVSSTRFDGVAGLIAGQVPFGFLGTSKLAYSYLTRHNLEYRFREGGAAPGSSYPSAGTLDTVSASFDYDTRLREYWGGLTWSTPFDRYGIGISLFVANRSQRMSYGTALTATAEDGEVSALSSSRAYSYYDWRLLSKIGVSTSFERWNLGLTITTPSLHLFGSGDISEESLGILGGGETVTMTFQDGLRSGYASSWAIGAGGEYAGQNWKAHIALEWFDRVDNTVLDANPYRSQTDSTIVIDPDVTNVMKGLLNVAVGYEHEFSETYGGYATFFTDWTGSEAGDGSVTTTTPWNLWTFGLGAIFSVGRSEFTAGLTYKFGGRDEIGRFDLIPGDTLDDQVVTSSVDGRFWRLALVLGFKLEFAPDL